MTLPKLGFLGVGWIGRNRMEAVLSSETAEVCAIADASEEATKAAAALAPGARVCDSYETMLELGLDGIVIATPSAQHAEQSIAALQRGLAVFCQKPLARSHAETRAVLAAAQKADRYLAVDFCYRFTDAMARIHELARAGELGDIYAANLVFHNAYGPDKPWFYDRQLSGGGCVIDLGVHLIDAALWMLDFPAVQSVTSRMFAGGRPLAPGSEAVEDFATTRIDLATGAAVDLACSWNLSAGQDAVISAEFYGTKAAAAFRNVNGSFYDFEAFCMRKTSREQLAAPPDAWGGKPITAFARRLQESRRYDESASELARVAEVVDAIYGRSEPAERASRATAEPRNASARLEPGAA